MRTILITFLLTLLFTFSINAQSRLSEGNIFLGGAATIGNVSSVGGASYFSYRLTPTLGYFVTDKIAVGGNVGISGNNNSGEMESSLVLSPFIRNYFITTERMGLYGAASLPLTLINDDRVGLNVSAGLTFFATERIALEARTSLFSLTRRLGGSETTNLNLGLNTNSVGLGFLIFL